MESYAESSDDSTKIKKLEKVIENLLKADENWEEEMVGLKRKFDNLNWVVTSMKKNKRTKCSGDEKEEWRCGSMDKAKVDAEIQIITTDQCNNWRTIAFNL